MLGTLLIAGGVLWARYGGSDQERPTAVAESEPPAPEPVALVPQPIAVDAAPAIAPPDAAPVVTEQPAEKRDRRKKVDARTAAVTVPPPGVVTPADFDRRYRQVGALLDKLTSQRGEQAADALRDKYFAIPYADALRSDSVRRDADRALRALASRISTELKASN